MTVEIPDTHKDLLGAPVFVVLSTLMPDGQPQSSVVWCHTDGSYVFVNTARGRQKEKNMATRPMATVMAVDPQNPFRWIEVRGTVEEITAEGGVDHINQLAKAYINAPSYYGGVASADLADKETRVICKIKATRVIAFGE